jgi:hypothetical protein
MSMVPRNNRKTSRPDGLAFPVVLFPCSSHDETVVSYVRSPAVATALVSEARARAKSNLRWNSWVRLGLHVLPDSDIDKVIQGRHETDTYL